MQDERADRVENGDHGDRRERRVRAVAAGRLAVAADPVAGDRQQQRRDAERLEASPCRAAGRPTKPRGRPEIAPRSSAIATSVTSSRSGVPPRISIVRDDRHLQDDRDEDDRRRPSARRARSLGSFGTSTMTASSESKVDEGRDLDLLERVGVGLADARVTGRSGCRAGRATAAVPTPRARGDDVSPLRHDLLLRHAVERRASAALRRDSTIPTRAGASLRGDRARLVGEQRHARRVGRRPSSPRRRAPPAVTTGASYLMPSFEPADDHDLLLERVGCCATTRRVHRAVVLRDPGGAW